MNQVAVVVLAGTDSKSDLGRVVNALQTVKECDEHDDEVELIFDGAGTQWIPELSDESHPYHALFTTVEAYARACEYCVSAFDVEEGVAGSNVEPDGEYEGHPSIRSLVDDGYEIITF